MRAPVARHTLQASGRPWRSLGTYANARAIGCMRGVRSEVIRAPGILHLWNATPTSVKNISRFLPLRFSLAAIPTFSRISQHPMQGSVLTLANESSSLRGLKSVFFCLVSCIAIQDTIAGIVKPIPTVHKIGQYEPSIRRCMSEFAAPSTLLTV